MMKFAACILGVALHFPFGQALSEEEPPAIVEDARKAKQQFKAGHFAEAEKLYRQALDQAPGNIHLTLDLAVVHFRMGKFALAEAGLKKAIAAAPEDDFSHCMLGEVYHAQGKFGEALSAFKKALALNPQNTNARNYLDPIAAERERMEAAEKLRQKAATLDPIASDSTYRAPAYSSPVGDFLTPLERSRLKVPPRGYRPLLPPASPPVRQ